MWKKRPDLPDEGGVRIPGGAQARQDEDSAAEVHVESVRKKARHQIVFTGVLFAVLFAAMTVYFCRYAIVNRRTLFEDTHNHRDELLEQHNRRGMILADDKETALALTRENNEREYPFDEMFCHTVGYSVLDGSGIESYMKYELLTSDIPFKSKLACDREGEPYPGNDVYTTLNVDLQSYAYEALQEGDYRGAVIVTEPSTGHIKAMVSMPGFNPNDISWRWEELRTDQSGRAQLLNRATQGIYAPGSTFKIVDAIELLQENPGAFRDFYFDCEDGTYTFDGESIHCFDYEHHYGQNLQQAFAHSCNSAFAKIVTEYLNKDSFRKTLKKLLFDKDLPYDFTCSDSHSQLLEEENISTHNLMQVAIGQGTTGVSPLHMNMITMAVANGGVLMRPYMISEVRTAENEVLQQYRERQAATLMDEDVAGLVRTLMRGVTQVTEDPDTHRQIWGTASEFDSTTDYIAFGKTGTAEFGDGEDSHAWFTGFTVDSRNGEDGEPDLCITVLIENGGAGSDKAVPVAKKILDAWYGQE